MLLLILFLIKNPEIKEIKELSEKLQETFGKELGHNDLGIELNTLAIAGIIDKNADVTLDGLKILAESKVLNYIAENQLDPGSITKKAVLFFLNKDQGITKEKIQREVDAFFGQSLLGHSVKFFLDMLRGEDIIKKEKNLYFLV